MKALNAVKRDLDKLRKWWTAPTEVYVRTEDRMPGDPYTRPREVEEYPEAQRLYWHATINEVDQMMMRLTELRARCLEEYHRTPENPAPLVIPEGG
jgi:hypothetical protein